MKRIGEGFRRFLGRSSGSNRYPNLSRDWTDLDCKATSCIFCKLFKCITPSRAKIGEDGRCEGFKTEEIQKRKIK